MGWAGRGRAGQGPHLGQAVGCGGGEPLHAGPGEGGTRGGRIEVARAASRSDRVFELFVKVLQTDFGNLVCRWRCKERGCWRGAGKGKGSPAATPFSDRKEGRTPTNKPFPQKLARRLLFKFQMSGGEGFLSGGFLPGSCGAAGHRRAGRAGSGGFCYGRETPRDPRARRGRPTNDRHPEGPLRETTPGKESGAVGPPTAKSEANQTGRPANSLLLPLRPTSPFKKSGSERSANHMRRKSGQPIGDEHS